MVAKDHIFAPSLADEEPARELYKGRRILVVVSDVNLRVSVRVTFLPSIRLQFF